MLIAAADITFLCEPSALERACSTLSDSERAAISRMRLPLSRAQRAGGYLLRNRLFSRAGILPDGIIIERFDSGKPYLADHPELSYSISHSGCLSVCALAVNAEVGADIEQTPQAVADEERFERLAQRCFASGERAAFTASDNPVEEFYRQWTRKEALFKFRRLSNESSLAAYDTYSAPDAEFTEYRLYDDSLNAYLATVCLPFGYDGDVPARVEMMQIEK